MNYTSQGNGIWMDLYSMNASNYLFFKTWHLYQYSEISFNKVFNKCDLKLFLQIETSIEWFKLLEDSPSPSGYFVFPVKRTTKS